MRGSKRASATPGAPMPLPTSSQVSRAPSRSRAPGASAPSRRIAAASANKRSTSSSGSRAAVRSTRSFQAATSSANRVPCSTSLRPASLATSRPTAPSRRSMRGPKSAASLGAGIGIPYSVDRVASRLPEIERWLAELAGEETSFDFDTIAGGASPRKFHRVRAVPRTPQRALDLFGGEATAIVMEVPPDTPDVAFARGLGRPWPFLEVRALLEEKGVRVPRLLADAHERDLLLVEDLGPTLASHLDTHPNEREPWYSAAVRDLSRAQAALDPLPENSIVRLRAFDDALLGFEIDHFREFGLEARGTTLTAAERATFDAARAVLVGTIAAYPRGFVHRDYQSRNLLVTPSAGVRHGEVPGGGL